MSEFIFIQQCHRNPLLTLRSEGFLHPSPCCPGSTAACRGNGQKPHRGSCEAHQVGVERIMFSVDYPYGSMTEARAFLQHLPVSKIDRERIAHGNAEKLFGLQNTARCELP